MTAPSVPRKDAGVNTFQDEYGERMKGWTGETIPPGIEEAIRSARRKYEAGEPLGFTVEAMLQEAQMKVQAKMEE